MAASTALMKVRMRLTREWLIVSRRSFRRMRFLACGVFAMKVLVYLGSMKKRREAKWPRRHGGSHMIRGREGQLLALACGAKERRTAALNDAPDLAPAIARLPFAVVHSEPLGEIAEFTVGTGEIAERGSTGCDRLGKNVVDSRHQPFQPRERYLSACSRRMNPRPVERLADVDVAKARDDPLVQQQRLDRRIAAFEAVPKFSRADVQRLRTKRGDGRPVRQR